MKEGKTGETATKVRIICFFRYSVISDIFFCAYFIRFEFDVETIPQNFVDNMLPLLVVSIILKIAVFIPFKLYRSLWRYAGVYELVSVFLASAITNGALFIYIAFINRLAPRSIVIIVGMIDVFFIGGSRLAFRLYRRLVQKSYLEQNIKQRIQSV